MISHEDVEKYLLKIFSGKDIVPIKKDGRDIFIIFKYPTIEVRMSSNFVYEDSYKKAIEDWEKAFEFGHYDSHIIRRRILEVKKILRSRGK